MKYNLAYNFRIIICQIMLTAISFSACPLPNEYYCENNINVIHCLKETVKKELHIVEYTKNIGYNTTDESIAIVLENDIIITDTSKKYDVPKEMIQAVLFKELRMIDFRDSISDSFVDNCYRINHDLANITDKNVFEKFLLWVSDTQGSSTGIGQIFPETAIKAYNWYSSNTKGSNCKCIDCSDTMQRESIWRALQDDKTSINFIALILKYEATVNLEIDINNASDEEIKQVFIKYNGATYYGDEVFKYYSLFREIKPIRTQISHNASK